MAENQVYLIKSGQNSFVEETNAIIGIDNAGRVGIGTTAPEADFHVTGNTQIDGNLTVKGNLTTVDSTTIQVDDKNIELGVGSTTDAAADGGGITLHGDGTKTFNWIDATDAWTSSEHLRLAAGKNFAADGIRALGAGGLSVGDDAGNGIFIEDGGQVGIGTTTPGYDLDVVGSGRFSNSLYVGSYKVYTTNDGSWKWQDSADDIYYTAGKVGVANDSPVYNLHVSGDAAVDGNFIVNGTSGNFNVEELNVSGDYVHVNYLSEGLASNRGGLQVHAANGTGKLEYLSDSDHWQFNKKIEVLDDVDVQKNLTIGGNLTVNGTTTTVNTETLEIEDHNLVIASNVDHTQLTNDHPDGTSEYAGILWGTGDGRPSLTYQSTKGFSFEGGNVGIGTANPSLAKLQIEGSNDLLRLTSTRDGTAGAEIALIQESNSAAEGDAVGLINFIGKNADDTLTTWASIRGIHGDYSNKGGDISFSNRLGNDFAESMRITHDGNVGIGTTNPAAKLDVNGEILQSGNTVVDQGDIGSEPNQIPLNKDLGTLAYMDAPEIEDLNVDTLELREMAAELSDTAVDVFVYDTRKDSDGGAWRNRTSHTSWYNEELNTATRGGRREFPAVAVIVAESNKVTIYDGDDPDLSMWMVFNTDLAGWHLGGYDSSANVTSITMLNGILVAGATHPTNANSRSLLSIVQFITDKNTAYRHETDVGLLDFGEVVDRNLMSTYVVINDGSRPINPITNDVAMTVLPNAPIDSETGLPVPTIAVATDAGVSVIRDDGSVVDITCSQTSFVYSYYVVFDQLNRLFFSLDGQGNKRRIWGLNNIPTADLIVTTNINEKQNGDIFIADDNGFGTATKDMFLFNQSNPQVEDFASDNSIGTSQGLFKAFIDKENSSKSLYSYTTSSYNTGWMPGDIKLATLSENTVETVGVNETTSLIENTTDWTGANSTLSSTLPTGWTMNSAYSALVSVAGGELTIKENNTSNYGIILQTFNIEAEKTYTLKAKFKANAGNARIWIGTSGTGGTDDVVRFFQNSTSTYTEISHTFSRDSSVIGNGSVKVSIAAQGADAEAVFDYVSVTEAGELISNGTFDNATEGWTEFDNSTISVDAGRLKVFQQAGASAYAYQLIQTQPGKKYNLTANFEYGLNVGAIRVSSNNGNFYSGNLYNTGYINTSFVNATFTATTTGTYIAVQSYGGISGYVFVDNVSVRLAEDDRSVNNNGLQVFGQIEKTPVAPGADLVAYSKFSKNNYLMQPYNPDLDFGTGDFCVMGWVNLNSQTSNKHIFTLSDGQGLVWGNNGYIACKWNGPSSRFEFNYAVGGLLMDVNFSNIGWQHFTLLRKNGVIKMYTNANYITSAISNIEMGLTNSDSNLLVGGAYYNSNLSGHSNYYLSLLRISKTAPTPEQIAKIYRDEKVLFQDGAQATLYGTSDAVTALAYDDSDNLLHVGTASGRSVFNGLKRVDNTDVAVTTAISAKKGFVIAQ